MTAWAVDHLVVAAATLEDGVRWCERVLGITPGPGGRHATMGTHNRLFSIAGPSFPRAYFEILAVDPQGVAPLRPRWFDLDEARQRAALAVGPRLIHWVARSASLAADRAVLRAAGHDPGEPIAAERDSAQGLLRWTLTVGADGRLHCGGALPSLIAWDARHPTDAMAPSGVALQGLEVCGLPPEAVGRLPAGVVHRPGGPALCARLATPRGLVTLGT